MTKTRTSVRRWRSKACVSAHSRTVPVNPPQPTHCCHRAAAVALCATDTLRTATMAADAAAATVPPPSCRQSRAVAMPPPPLTLPMPLRCRRHAVHCRRASRCCHRRSLCAAATALPPTRCALPPCFALPPPPLMLPPLPHCRHAAANATLALVDCYISTVFT
jgi:hypothetical protein